MSFRPEIIIGPPGTGKTTRLLDEVSQALSNDSPPEKIGYMAFTRKAANEAIERAAVQFGFIEKQLPYFRTLHSFAFRMLGLRREQVLGRKTLDEFGRVMGLRITGSVNVDEGQTFGTLPGDRAMFICALSRMKRITLKEQWEENNEDLGWWEVERVFRGLKEFKTTKGLADFTDMLEQYIAYGVTPHLDLLVVDEAQDLSRLQWEMVEKMAQTARRVIVAGDDDQAIFRWAGADVSYFVNLKGKTTTLDQSYRIPKQVQNLALDVIKRVKERRTKEWSPREAEGSLEYRPTTDGIDFSAGEWLILARNNYLLEAVEEQCRREGWIFEKNGRRSVSDKTLNTIRGWEALRKGELVSHSVARDILRVIPRKSKWFPKDGQYSLQNLKEDYGVNTKSIWHEAFEKMSLVERSYLVAALRRGEKVSKRPRISMNTIHSVKGGQADNVVLFSDIAQRTYRALLNFPEDEHRVFYVGITRAKEKLIVILPNSKFFFAGL